MPEMRVWIVRKAGVAEAVVTARDEEGAKRAADQVGRRRFVGCPDVEVVPRDFVADYLRHPQCLLMFDVNDVIDGWLV